MIYWWKRPALCFQPALSLFDFPTIFSSIYQFPFFLPFSLDNTVSPFRLVFSSVQQLHTFVFLLFILLQSQNSVRVKFEPAKFKGGSFIWTFFKNICEELNFESNFFHCTDVNSPPELSSQHLQSCFGSTVSHPSQKPKQKLYLTRYVPLILAVFSFPVCSQNRVLHKDCRPTRVRHISDYFYWISRERLWKGWKSHLLPS